MSGLAAVFNLDGRPLDPALLDRLTDAVAHRGPDGRGTWCEGPVGLGHRIFRTTPESCHESQPYRARNGSVAILDGRLDNRDELFSGLRRTSEHLRDLTDIELLARSYERWGDDCVSRLLGDFAFVVWDPRRRSLLLGRDHIGVRPLMWWSDGRSFLACSEVHQLFEHPRFVPRPDEGMVAEYLANQVTSHEATLYQGVSRLPAAHRLTVRDGAIGAPRRYWDLSVEPEGSEGTSGEDAEHLRELFERAVACRLRAVGPVGLELSGGLDSTTVVATAARLRRSGRVGPCELHAFSMAFPGYACDETSFAREAASHGDIPLTIVSPGPEGNLSHEQQARRDRWLPEGPFGDVWGGLRRTMAERGCRVTLTGHGGDSWFLGSYWILADLLRRGSVYRALSEARALARCIPERPARLLLVDEGVRPLVRTYVPASVRRWRRARQFPWIPVDFARRVGFVDRISASSPGRLGTDYGRRRPWLELHDGWTPGTLEWQDLLGARSGHETRHPMNDVRLIEFAASMAPERHLDAGWTRRAHRKAVIGLIPDRIRLRTTKADFSHPIVRSMVSAGWGAHLQSSAIAELGWVDIERMRSMYDAMVAAVDGGVLWPPHLWPVFFAISLEVWYRAVFGMIE